PGTRPQGAAGPAGGTGLVMRGATLVLIAAISTTGAAFGKPVQRDSVQIWTTLSAPVVPLGGTTILELHVETSGAAPQRIVLPDLPPEIEVVGTREYSQIRFSVGGSGARLVRRELVLDRKSTRLNSSHVKNSNAVFCL